MANNNESSSRGQKKRNKVESEAYIKADIDNLEENYIILIKKQSSKHPKAKFFCKICSYHMDDLEKALKHKNDTKHNKNVQNHEKKRMMFYMPKPNEDHIEALNNCLNKLFEKNIFLKDQDIASRMKICSEIDLTAKKINPNFNIKVCGSLLTGLSMKRSDVNLHFEQGTSNNVESSYLDDLKALEVEINKNFKFKTEIKIDKVSNGLYCYDSSHTAYHISSNYGNFMLTSNLIKLYLSLDDRVLKLAKLFRYFANEAHIDLCKDGLFPSHVFALMVIFYLQKLEIPILPNLHQLAQISDIPETSKWSQIIREETVSYVNDIEYIRKFWNPPANSMSLAELWIGLLQFYSVDFDSSLYMVSISSFEPVLKISRNISNKRISVEDPFDYKRNLLFSWNSNDVVEYFYDQLQSAFVYFAVPQLKSGAAFSKIAYIEPSIEKLPRYMSSNPLFSFDSSKGGFDRIIEKLKKVFEKYKNIYNVTKWPIKHFIINCLKITLFGIINSDEDIFNIVTLLDLKLIKPNQILMINDCETFLKYAMNLYETVNEEFKEYCKEKNTWKALEQNSDDIFQIVKKAVIDFVKSSLQLENIEDDEDVDDTEALEDISEDVNLEEEITPEEEIQLCDAEDTPVKIVNGDSEAIHIDIRKDSWKIPIAYSDIIVIRKGKINDQIIQDDTYNRLTMETIKKEDINFNFYKIPIHRQKLSVVCIYCNTKGHRKETCIYAIPRYDDLTGCIEKIDKEIFKKIHVVLEQKYKHTLIKEEKKIMNTKLFNDICDYIKAIHPNAKPQLFGSTNNGFMTKSSDLDICLEYYDENNSRILLSNKEIGRKLREIGRELRKHIYGLRIDYILRAKVPIVKFYTNNIQGDISINNILAIQNTKMLRLYADINPIVQKLGNLLKFVAKTCEIGDASQGTLSSYAYIIMLIHFLQKRNILPVLQELHDGNKPNITIDGWNAWYESNLSIIEKKWSKDPEKEDIGYLWVDFFYYYIVEFNINDEVVCIRRSKSLHKIDKNWQSSYLAIEDPFDLSHNLSGCLSLENCRYILTCFSHILQTHTCMDILLDDRRLQVLLEPKYLKPEANINSHKTCYDCNKPGHISKDCPLRSANKRSVTKTSTINEATKPQMNQQSSSSSSISTCYKLLSYPNKSNNQFLTVNSNHLDLSHSGYPLETIIKDSKKRFYVIPVSVPYGDVKVIIPMLTDENGNVIQNLVHQLNKKHDEFPLMQQSNNLTPIQTQQRFDCIPVVKDMMDSVHMHNNTDMRQRNPSASYQQAYPPLQISYAQRFPQPNPSLSAQRPISQNPITPRQNHPQPSPHNFSTTHPHPRPQPHTPQPIHHPYPQQHPHPHQHPHPQQQYRASHYMNFMPYQASAYGNNYSNPYMHHQNHQEQQQQHQQQQQQQQQQIQHNNNNQRKPNKRR